jgi:carbonic anhydrase
MDIELQFVHKSRADGSIAIVSVLVEGQTDLANNDYATLIASTDAKSLNLNLDSLLPPYRSFFHYTGSMTSPPCTEGVTWLVLSNLVHASKAQVAALRKLHPTGNARPVTTYHPTAELGNSSNWATESQ